MTAQDGLQGGSDSPADMEHPYAYPSSLEALEAYLESRVRYWRGEARLHTFQPSVKAFEEGTAGAYADALLRLKHVLKEIA